MGAFWVFYQILVVQSNQTARAGGVVALATLIGLKLFPAHSTLTRTYVVQGMVLALAEGANSSLAFLAILHGFAGLEFSVALEALAAACRKKLIVLQACYKSAFFTLCVFRLGLEFDKDAVLTI